MLTKIQTPDVPKPKLMTARELAAYFAVTPRTVGRWRQDGRIPFVTTPGGTYRYDPMEVEQSLLNQPAKVQ